MIYIYKHRNNINNKIYIGQTNNIKKRWNPSRYKDSPRFYNAIQKYGWDNFTHEILSEIEDQNEADNQEIALIEYFDSTNPEKGYNISHGGNAPTRGKHLSEETRKKMSVSKKGIKLPPFSEEHKKKLSLSYHTVMTDEIKKKMSDSKKGKYNSSSNPRAREVYLIDTIDGWDEYYPCIKDICKKYPEWKAETLRSAAARNSLFKNRYKIEYLN